MFSLNFWTRTNVFVWSLNRGSPRGNGTLQMTPYTSHLVEYRPFYPTLTGKPTVSRTPSRSVKMYGQKLCVFMTLPFMRSYMDLNRHYTSTGLYR